MKYIFITLVLVLISSGCAMKPGDWDDIGRGLSQGVQQINSQPDNPLMSYQPQRYQPQQIQQCHVVNMGYGYYQTQCQSY